MCASAGASERATSEGGWSGADLERALGESKFSYLRASRNARRCPGGTNSSRANCASGRRPEYRDNPSVNLRRGPREISSSRISRATRYADGTARDRLDNPAMLSTGDGQLLTISITVKGINSPLSLLRPSCEFRFQRLSTRSSPHVYSIRKINSRELTES